jgi:hypothetical protein
MKQSTGRGVLKFSDGGRYVGDLWHGVPHGRGVYTYGKRSGSPGARYEGDFREGSFEGEGLLWIPNRGWYKGDFRDGLMHGHGTFSFRTGKKYVGEFFRGDASGVGIEYSQDWTLIRGGFWKNWKIVSGPNPSESGLTKRVQRILGENPHHAS